MVSTARRLSGVFAFESAAVARRMHLQARSPVYGARRLIGVFVCSALQYSICRSSAVRRSLLLQLDA
jgi:hypothetical protein